METDDHDDQLERWLGDEPPSEMLSMPLPNKLAQKIVDGLKKEADRYWSINPKYSLKYADRIVAIGRLREDKSQEALGLMARGDAFKHLGNLPEAWDMFEQSGSMYQMANDEVGWARTRISRLALGPALNRVRETLADAEKARAIFLEHNEQEKLVRLKINTAYVHTLLGDQHQALQLYQSALVIAESLGTAGEPHLGLLYMNIGYAHEVLGDFPQALLYYERARLLYMERHETRSLINIEKNIACIALAQGHYRSALNRLNTIQGPEVEQFPEDYAGVRHSVAECYLNLNRYSEARDLMQQVIEGYRSFNDTYNSARALLHLATAEVELGDLASAKEALDQAASIFSTLNALTWGMIAHLWYGEVAFKQGDYETAWQESQTAAECFRIEGQEVNYAAACILSGQVALACDNFVSASLHARHALQISQLYNVPSIRYVAHLLLGRIAVANSWPLKAIRHFRAAAATIDRVQRGLTITLRSGFLENKGEAWRELISLYLQSGQTSYAFDALEQAKSQVLVNYLTNREQFRWSHDDPESQALIDELERLRAEHQMFYHRAFNPPREQDLPNSPQPEQAHDELAVREKRMRAITEKLYLRSHAENSLSSSFGAFLPEIQAALDEHTLLVEFYDDGTQFWAFTLHGHSCEVRPLAIKTELLQKLISQLKANFSASLGIDPHAQTAKPLTAMAQRLLQRLYNALLAPLEIQSHGRKRLIVVPYGVLHYLPFHLLHDGADYLIENYEVVTLPTASLVTRAGPHRSSGALIISNSWNGRLRHTLEESQIVQNLFGGTLYAEELATRSVLRKEPSQILHIATHGQHRPDQPDLSFLELADGQLYADDLLQQDLSYELVTLSACETGQANVAADEELIGIGRGLLYAGAGALILSLWQVTDTTTTLAFMEHLYSALYAGKSKAAALREAQLFILQQDRQLHPALWGAFQLIGNAQPLSKLN